MFKKKIGAVLLSAICLAAAIPSVPAMADSQKVVTLGADLSEEQKTMILQYFGVYGETNIETLTITNADEREHLGSYIPLEQIGTRTYSCALVSPTTSGGIQVKTANLTYVTSNMIASTLSTSGVVNCEVLAAAPFAVSGTGALTGILMAYETASGETLDETKKETATQELVTTTTISDSIGQVEATQIVNETKIQVIEGDVVSTGDIEVIVDTVVEEEDVTLSEEDRALLVALLEKIAEQDYDYEEMSETLERVEENLNEIKESQSSDSDSTSVDINIEINNDSSSSSDSSSDSSSSSDSDSSSDSSSSSDSDSSSLSEDSILLNTDDSALGSDVVFDATDDSALAETEAETEIETEASNTSETDADITIETEASQTEAATESTETEAAETEASDDSIGFDITISDSYSDSADADTFDGSSDTVETDAADTGTDTVETEGADSTDSDTSESEDSADDGIVIETAETEAISITELVLEPNTDSDAAQTATIEAGLNYLTVSSARTDLIAGTGTLSIYNAADGSLIESVELSDTEKVISEQITDAAELLELGGWSEGIEFRIYLDSPLSPDTSFYIILSDDAFTTADGSASLVTSLDGAITWYFDTLSYGIGLDETVDGVTAGEAVTGTLYIDTAESAYAVIDSVLADDIETMIEENYIAFTESVNTFELTFGQSGDTVIHVSYYDSADTMNLVNEATYELTVQ